jgi:hypothetical protein
MLSANGNILEEHLTSILDENKTSKGKGDKDAGRGTVGILSGMRIDIGN